MRWQFADSSIAEEATHRGDMLGRIDAWWTAFAARAGDLDAAFSRRGDLDIPAFMARHLQAVDPRICWEFGRSLRGTGHRLVITPESQRQLRPVVQTLLERAPALAGWEFYPYRPPESVEMAHVTVSARCGGMTAPDAEIRLTRGKGNRIDLTFCSAAFEPGSGPAAYAAFVFAETLLGEEALDKWVGAVDAVPAPRSGLMSKLFGKGGGGREGGLFLPLDRAKPTFDAVVSALRDQLPDRPLHEMNLTGSGAAWTSFEVKPQEGHADSGRDDIFIGSSAAFGLTEAAAGPGFHSGRFSRFGETFCYLKLRHEGIPRDRWVDFRAAFEDALEPALRRSKAGCVYATATGLTSSYIDLAVSDLPGAIDTIRAVLRPLDVTKQSWLCSSTRSAPTNGSAFGTKRHRR
jgi:hypothetical protein